VDQSAQKLRFHWLQTKTDFRTVRGETCFDVSGRYWTQVPCEKPGEMPCLPIALQMRCKCAANALQIPGEFPQLALLVESWPMSLAINKDVVQQLFQRHRDCNPASK
jgi:hypothetical protein